jgi:hypothetical protein
MIETRILPTDSSVNLNFDLENEERSQNPGPWDEAVTGEFFF